MSPSDEALVSITTRTWGRGMQKRTHGAGERVDAEGGVESEGEAVIVLATEADPLAALDADRNTLPRAHTVCAWIGPHAQRFRPLEGRLQHQKLARSIGSSARADVVAAQHDMIPARLFPLHLLAFAFHRGR